MARLPWRVELLPFRYVLDCFFPRNSIVAQENLSSQVHTSRERFASRFCGLLIVQLLQQSPLTLSGWADECVLTLLAGQALEGR